MRFQCQSLYILHHSMTRRHCLTLSMTLPDAAFQIRSTCRLRTQSMLCPRSPLTLVFSTMMSLTKVL